MNITCKFKRSLYLPIVIIGIVLDFSCQIGKKSEQVSPGSVYSNIEIFSVTVDSTYEFKEMEISFRPKSNYVTYREIYCFKKVILENNQKKIGYILDTSKKRKEFFGWYWKKGDKLEIKLDTFQRPYKKNQNWKLTKFIIMQDSAIYEIGTGLIYKKKYDSKGNRKF